MYHVCWILFIVIFLLWFLFRVLVALSVSFNSTNTLYCHDSPCTSTPIPQYHRLNTRIDTFRQFNVRYAYQCIQWINNLYNNESVSPDFIRIADLFLSDHKLFGCIEQSIEHPNEIYIIFRGTMNVQDVVKDSSVHQTPFLDYPTTISTHKGFSSVYTQIRDQIFSVIQTLQPTHVLWSGHSLGAAIALLGLFDQHTHFPEIVTVAYLFACPRVGNITFSTKIPSESCFRIVNTEDVVNELPLSITIRPFNPYHPFIYQHAGRVYSFSDNRKSLLLNHSIDTYAANLSSLVLHNKAVQLL